MLQTLGVQSVSVQWARSQQGHRGFQRTVVRGPRLLMAFMLALTLVLTLVGCASHGDLSAPAAALDDQRLLRLAQRAEQQGNASLAISLYRQSLSAHEDTASRQALFWLYRRTAQWQLANELLSPVPSPVYMSSTPTNAERQRSTARWPRHGWACARAAQLMDEQQWSAAQHQLEGISVDARWPQCAAMQARLALQQRQYPLAKSLFERLRQWQPQRWQHSYNLALLALLQQQPAQALQQLHGICISPDDCPAAARELTTLSLVLAQRHNDAAQWLSRSALSRDEWQAQLTYYQSLSPTSPTSATRLVHTSHDGASASDSTDDIGSGYSTQVTSAGGGNAGTGQAKRVSP
ncbi:hypothetical protein CHH28_09170 [Bacterioplanes sanyensis]|uniref:Uncharacterized protein n=1 Tax=Bacterioplanes sanyensis TaxID=1249553 RepID=A0A222FJ89_9GAMM|nr:hypothetical protein [Bacterioplanes sanyensis]ASP38840.1 hypothetical protein CHH28_09170 [Bacterioplanes sanyensis]